eukprot:245707-Amphidinium_carterae.1
MENVSQLARWTELQGGEVRREYAHKSKYELETSESNLTREDLGKMCAKTFAQMEQKAFAVAICC